MEAGPHVQIATEGSGSGPRPGVVRAALVHDWLTGMRGGEKCLEVLCRAFPDAPLFTLLHRKGAMSPAIESMDIRTSPLQRMPGALRHYRHLLPFMPVAARSWRPAAVDVVVSLSHCVAKSVRVPAGVPHVCYCFTPMRYAWDGRSAYLDGWRGKPVRRSLAGATLDRLRDWDRASAAGVTQFVAISETVRRRIARCYGRESRVIPPPVDTSFYTPDPTALRDGPYLCVSALVPYKKLDHAVAACSASGRELIVIGSGPERARLERLAGPTVRFLGWQPDEAIREHYRRCRALLFPGEEDFGIVPAEALACGSPVIALNRGGVAETVDDRVGWLYDEPGPDCLRRAIDAFEAADRPHDPMLARRKAEALAPEVFRDRMLALIDELLADRPRTPAPHVPIGPRSRISIPRPRGRVAG
jgi:glycosyltransferase involved in cell wall biosynthesis